MNAATPLDIITADSLAPLRHGFFGRAGGASSGVFAGLNCGPGSSDQHEAVRINRARVAREMEVAPEALIGLYQIHSADVVKVTAPGASRPAPTRWSPTAPASRSPFSPPIASLCSSPMPRRR